MRSAACGKCQQPFADRQEYVSRLTFGADGYERLDCCAACWNEADRRTDAVSIWRGVFELPPPPPPEPLKKETAESLLRDLLQKQDDTKVNVVFILAVMLERRRIIIERDMRRREDGARLRVYEHRKTGDTFVIVDPMLNINELEHVQREVMDMLTTAQPSGRTACA